jgi:hypothetical protein
VLKDSIYHEKIDQSTKNNINVLATAKKNQEQCRLQEAGQALPQQADPEVDQPRNTPAPRSKSTSRSPTCQANDRLKKLSRLAQLFAFLP